MFNNFFCLLGSIKFNFILLWVVIKFDNLKINQININSVYIMWLQDTERDKQSNVLIARSQPAAVLNQDNKNSKRSTNLADLKEIIDRTR